MSHDPYTPLLPSWLTANVSSTLEVYILVLCFALCWYQWKQVRAYRHFPSRSVVVEWALMMVLGRFQKDAPVTSVAWQIILNSVNRLREEGLCVLWFFRPFIFVYNEKFMKDLMNEPGLVDKATPYNINKLLFGNGLLGSTREKWQVHRKLLNPGFNMGVLKSKMPSFNKYAFELVQKLETRLDKPADDVWRFLKYSAFQNLADFVLGLEMNGKSHVTLGESFIKAIDVGEILFIGRIMRPWLYPNFMLPLFQFGRDYLKIIDESNYLGRKVKDELTKKISLFEKEKQNDDFWNVTSCGDILTKQHLQNPKFTDQDLRDHFINFVSAGYDSIAISMLMSFYYLGHHPEKQEKVYSEVMSIVPEGDITYTHLTKLKYLDCVLKETQRLHSSVPIFARKAAKDIKCGQYTIPKGTDVCFFPFMLHRDPNIFPEPEKFIPERFWNYPELRPWMYMPFAEGYRNCIGKRFAIMEMKVQLAYVIRRFRITSLDKMNDGNFEWKVVLKPMKPPTFLFENRHSETQV